MAIVVTISYWPYGMEWREKLVGQIIIGNTSEGDERTGSYQVVAKTITERRGKPLAYRTTARAKFDGFPRSRPDMRANHLALWALAKLYGRRSRITREFIAECVDAEIVDARSRKGSKLHVGQSRRSNGRL